MTLTQLCIIIKVVTRQFCLSAVLFTFLLYGCARHTIGYDVKKEFDQPVYKSIVVVGQFSDERPEEERLGIKNKELLVFCSTDKHFTSTVAQAVSEKLKEELTAGGVKAVLGNSYEGADYLLSGKIVHFQTITKLPKTTVVPYLGTVSSFWTKDEFITAVSISAQLVRLKDDEIIFDKSFDVSEELKLKTGPLNLARFERGLDYKLKLLDLALEDVLKQIRSEVIIAIKE